MTTATRDIEDVAKQVAADLRAGALTLGQVVGLTDAEVAAVTELAEGYRRRGKLQRAASVYGLLLSYTPYNAGGWERLADLQARLGNHPAAVACYEIVALLRDADRTLLEREARCLRLMGERELAAELLSPGNQG